jgi:hypothetical protein
VELPDFDLDDLYVLGKPQNQHRRREYLGAHVGRDVVKQGAGSGKHISETDGDDELMPHLTNQDNLFRRA